MAPGYSAKTNTNGAEEQRSEIIFCLMTGLRFLHGDTSEPEQHLARRILANIIIEHLEVSGYAIHKKLLPST